MAIILARMPHPVDFDPRLTCGLGASLPVPEPRTTIDSFGNRQAREDRNLRERRRSILSAGRPILNARYGSYAPQNQSFGADSTNPVSCRSSGSQWKCSCVETWCKLHRRRRRFARSALGDHQQSLRTTGRLVDFDGCLAKSCLAGEPSPLRWRSEVKTVFRQGKRRRSIWTETSHKHHPAGAKESSALFQRPKWLAPEVNKSDRK